MTSHNEYLECECAHPGHLVRMELYKGDVGDEVGIDPPELHVTQMLDAGAGLWARLCYAFVYVFRPYSQGCFSETLLGKESVEKLHALLLAWTVLDKMHQKKLRQAVKTP